MSRKLSLTGTLAVLGVLSAGCGTTIEVEVAVEHGPFDETEVTIDGSSTNVTGPKGSCVIVIFFDEQGREIRRTWGGVPNSFGNPPGTAKVRVESCPPTQSVASGLQRAPLRRPFPFLSVPCRLQDRLRFLVATAKGHSREEAEGWMSRREQEWTSTPDSPLVSVDAMVEAEVAGSALWVHVVAQDEIQRLDLRWNGADYATLDDAIVTAVNGWHVASFAIPPEDIEVPATSAVENSLHYEMDTLMRTGLTFDASVLLEP